VANRASAYVFVAVGFVLAMGVVKLSAGRLPGGLQWGLFVGFALVTFVGGFIAGWPTHSRLARPYLVATENATQIIEPQGVSAARWVHSRLGRDRYFAADLVNARLLFRYGDAIPLTGSAMGIRSMLMVDYIDASVREILEYTTTDYVLVDRRRSSWDSIAGLYFDRTAEPPALFDPRMYQKFDHAPGANRIFDSGDIVIYDVSRLINVDTFKR
jgi:hypothetical protein